MRLLLPFTVLVAAGCVDPADPDPTIDDGPDASVGPDGSVAPEAIARVNRQSPRLRGVPPADFDGDGALDLMIRLDKGGPVTAWLIDHSSNGFGAVDLRVEGWYGAYFDLPVPANYAGDARADLAVYSPQGTFYIDAASSGPAGGFTGWDYELPTSAGSVGEPVPADYNNDGKLDLAVLGDDTFWRIDFYEEDDERRGARLGFAGWDLELPLYGGANAYPVPADYNGDGWIDLAVRLDDGRWRIDHANPAFPPSPFGGFDTEKTGYGTSDVGMVATAVDFDGDRSADLAVRSTSGLWYIDLSTTPYVGFEMWPSGWGNDNSQPLPGDYDRDGIADLAVKDECGPWRIDYTRLDGAGRPVFAGVEQTVTWANPTGAIPVGNKDALLAALRQDFPASIDVSNGSSIDIGTDRNLAIPACARLTGGRAGRIAGALIHTTATLAEPVFLITGDRVTIDGVRFRGAGGTARTKGIKVASARSFRLARSEISGFTDSALAIDDDLGRVTRTAGLARVEDSYFHHNQTQEVGYGVNLGDGSWAQIERNVFSWNRHGITHDGSAESGYLAYRNLFLEGVMSDGFDALAHIDVHGTETDSHHGGVAGEYFDIGWNTIRGNQEIVPLPFTDAIQRPAINLRGHPTDRMEVHDNAFEHDQGHALIRCWFLLEFDFRQCTDRVSGWQNRFETDLTARLGVGDFDGDGVDDVFMGTGVTWWFSSGGITEWRFLNAMPDSADQLAFANVTGSAATDVIVRTADGSLRVSDGGTRPWSILTTSPVAVSQLHFSDFNGDGLTDIFRTDGHQWWIWDGLTRIWWPRVEANIAFGSLRFGEFNSTRGTDVLAVVGGVWKRNSGGSAASWTVHNNLGASLTNTVAADFDGDGLTDIARNGSSATWEWARGGRGSFVQLRGTSWPHADLGRFLIGSFEGGARDHALALEPQIDGLGIGSGRRFVFSRGAAAIPSLLTSIDMR